MPGEQRSGLYGAPGAPLVLVDDGHEDANARLDPGQVAQA